MRPDWLFIDGSSLIFRAFYGVPQTVVAPDGRLVNAVRGFLDTLARLLYARRPNLLAVASDEDWRPQWRVDLIPSYKSHRVAEPVPDALEPQFPLIHELLAAVGVDFVGVPEYEAEDVIATWTAKAVGTRIEVVSGDRDLFALVGDQIKVLYPERKGLAEVDDAELQRRYGVPGALYGDFAVLRGDPSDGLPGLPGVGPKTAAELVKRHGGVRGLITSGRYSEAQRDYLERALLTVLPVRDAPVELPPGRRDAYPTNPERAAELGRRYGVTSSVDRLVGALQSKR
ncbi:MAG: 5'-3' exonuclease [Candidatus Dormibacteraeota bacterium]|nr:5'-3' exonuclease [Candidatus Dormibacteraeota bacterium]